jgi:hypothetical protein
MISGILESSPFTEGATVARHRQPQSEWFTARDPDALLITLKLRPEVYSGGDVFENLTAPQLRRLRLFGCACVRMVWGMLSTEAQNAVAISERFANGHTTETTLQAAAVQMMYGPVTFQQYAANAAGWASAGYWGAVGRIEYHWNPIEASRDAQKALAARAAGPAPPGRPVTKEWTDEWTVAWNSARARQAEIVRDIFPPPDHAVRALRCDRSWLTPTVLTLARQADDTGEYGVLPILADALQDAGCDNEFILDRCRASLCKSGKPPGSPNAPSRSELHSRGNWVVDLLLGRE